MTLIYFILILGIVVFIHEFGHFLFAKRAGIYVYEFSIGMGPRIFKFKRKNDETEYSIRILPIGGFVQMAGEEVDVDEKIPENKRLQSKTWMQRFLTMFAGVMFNFILGIVILIVIYLINGAPVNNMKIAKSSIDGLNKGDTIIKVNDKKVSNYDMLTLQLQVVDKEEFELTVKDNNGKTKTVTTKMQSKNDKDGQNTYYYDFELDGTREKGFIVSITYAFKKLISTLQQMIFIIFYLITGKLSLSALSGPVGIYTVVGETRESGIENVLFLVAYLSINLGIMNILPIPALDGGHVLFLLIELITKKKINEKVESVITTIFFGLLLLLMLYITIHDVITLIL